MDNQKYTTYEWNLKGQKLNTNIKGVSYIHIIKLDIFVDLYFRMGDMGDWLKVKETDSINCKKSDIYFKANTYNFDNDRTIVKVVTSEDSTFTIDRMSNHNIQTINPKVIKELQIVKDIDIEALHKINFGKWLLNPVHEQSYTYKERKKFKQVVIDIDIKTFLTTEALVMTSSFKVQPFQKAIIKPIDSFTDSLIMGIVLNGGISTTVRIRDDSKGFNFVNTTDKVLELGLTYLSGGGSSSINFSENLIEVKYYNPIYSKFCLNFD